MWSLINGVSTATFNAWFWLIHVLSPTLQIFATALPVTFFALLVFRFSSNQHGIRQAKDRIKAHLLELWLYKDDLPVMLAAQFQVVRFSLRYLRLSLLPLVIMSGPVLLVIVQIESRFAFTALEPGESSIVSVAVDEEYPVNNLDVSLNVPEQVVRETPALRDVGTGQVFWRVSASRPGTFPLEVIVGQDVVTKNLVVGNAEKSFSSMIFRENDWRSLGYPLETPMGREVNIAAVKVAYPRARGEYLGLSSASWIMFGMTLLFGYLLRGSFGVTF